MDGKANRPPDIATTSVADGNHTILYVPLSMGNATSSSAAESSILTSISNNTSPSLETVQNNVQREDPSPTTPNNGLTQSNSATKSIETYFPPSPKGCDVPTRPAYLPSTKFSVVPCSVDNDANATSVVPAHPSYVENEARTLQSGVGPSVFSQLLPPSVGKEGGETQERAEKRRKLGSPRTNDIKAPIPWAKPEHMQLESKSHQSQLKSPEEVKMESNHVCDDVIILHDDSSQSAPPATHRRRSLEIPQRATTPPLAITDNTPSPPPMQSPTESYEEMELDDVLPSPVPSSDLKLVHETILRNRMEFEEDHFGMNLAKNADILSSDDSVSFDEYDPFFDTFDTPRRNIPPLSVEAIPTSFASNSCITRLPHAQLSSLSVAYEFMTNKRIRKPYMSKRARNFLRTQRDWTFLRQFEGEVIHVDFNQEEIENLRKCLSVPQRTTDDCTRFLHDYPDCALDYVAPTLIRIEPPRIPVPHRDRASLPLSLLRQHHRKEIGANYHPSDLELQALYKLKPCSTFNHASGDVIDFKFSPLNNQFAVCCNTLTNEYNRPGNLLFGDAKREVVSTLNGQADRTVGAERYYTVSDIRFSNDGQYLFSGSYDNTVKIWDVNGELVSCLTGHGRITALSTTECSDRVLAVASDDGNVYLYNVMNPRKQRRTVVKGLNERLYGAFLVPGQRHYSHWMIAGYEAKDSSPLGALYLIDIPTGTIIQRVVPASNCQSAAYFHPNAEYFVVGATGHFFGAGPTAKSVVRVFDPRTEKATMEIGLDSPQKDINSVTMSPCGFRVTSSGTDGKTCVWDLRTIKEGKPAEPLHILAHGCTKMVPPVDGQLEDWDTGVSVTEWLPQSDYLMTGGSDGFIKLWDTRLKDPFLRDIAEFDSPVTSANFNCERDILGVGESSGKVTFLDWHGPTVAGELRRFQLEQSAPESSGNEGILAARELLASGRVTVHEDQGLRSVFAV